MAGSRHSAVAMPSISASIGVDLPMPQKPTRATPQWDRLGGWQFRYVTEYKGGSGGIRPALR